MPSFDYRTITGDEVGPLSEEDVRAALAAGTISPFTMARSREGAVWRPLSDLLDLTHVAALPPLDVRPGPPQTPRVVGSTRIAPQPPDAFHPGAPPDAVTFVDLDPILQAKRRLLLVPSAIETLWGLSLVLTLPGLSFALVFSVLAGAALSLGRSSDPMAAAVLIGTAFVLFSLYTLVWLAPFAVFAAIKADAAWAILAMAVLGLASAVAVGHAAAWPPDMLYCVPLALAAVVAANSLAHLLMLANWRRDSVVRDVVLKPRRGALSGPGLGARLGAGWDLVRGSLPVAFIGCFTVLAASAVGTLGFLIYLGAWALVRRRASRFVLDAVAAARERLQRATDRRFPADAPDPILFLRSFADDVIRTDAFGTRALSAVFGVDLESVRLEESLVAAVRRAGPVIAIARPGHGRSAIGAARQRLSDDEWQATVSAHIARAACIMLVQGKTEGLGWELGEIRRQGHLDKLMLVVPPNRDAGMEEVVRAWSGRQGLAVPKSFIGRAPPLAVIAGDSAEALDACIASRRDAEAYRLAARLCLNRILRRKTSISAPDPMARAR